MGIGNIEKLETASNELEISWERPDAPPHKSHAAMIFISKKPKATGNPDIIIIAKPQKKMASNTGQSMFHLIDRVKSTD